MEKHYIIRQDIINLLGRHDNSLDTNAPLKEREVHFNKIQSALSQYTKNELLDYLQDLSDSEYIYCSMQGDNSKFFIKAKGRIAFHQNQFIVDGTKEETEREYNEMKRLIPSLNMKDKNEDKFYEKGTFWLTVLLVILTIALIYQGCK